MQKKSVVIVGGGAGGSFVANKLAYKSFEMVKKGELEITLIEPSDRIVYQPGFLYVPFRELPQDVMFRSAKKLYHPLVKHVPKAAAKIDIKEKKVTTADGRVYPYDYLVVATGSEIVTTHFPGFKKTWHTLWNYEGAKALKEALRQFTKGTLVFSVASTPYKCPVAPYEFVFMYDDYLMSTGLKKDVKIVLTHVAPHLHAQPNVNKFLTKELENRGIKFYTKFEISEIKEGEVVGPERLKADFIIAVPKHKPADVVTNSGLVDQSGWTPVDKHTLQIQGGSGVEYAIGDTTNLGVPKAGAVAHFQSEVAAARIYEDITYGRADSVYNGRVMCFVMTGLEEGTQVSWNYNTTALYPPTPNKFYGYLKELANNSMWSAMRCGL